MPCRKGRALGRPVDVQQVPRRSRRDDGGHASFIHRLAAEQQAVERREHSRIEIREPVEERRRQEQDVEPPCPDMPCEHRRIEQFLACERIDRRAIEQRAEDFKRRGIEGDIGAVRDAVAGPDRDVIGVLHQPNHRPVGDAHALGRPVEPEVYIT